MCKHCSYGTCSEMSARMVEQNETSVETNNLVADENLPMISPIEKEQLQEKEAKVPKDNYNMVFLIILLQGIGTLLPWNTFLTIAKTYFIDYKLEHANGTEYQQNFFSYLGVCSQIPNLLLNFLNLFIVATGASLSRRIFGSLFLIATTCLFTIMMIFVTSSDWPFKFFMLTMVSVVVLNSANGVYQNSIYGLMADFPFQFTNAVILGSNLCGIFVSLLAILMLFSFKDIQWAAFLYFSISLMTVIACSITFYLLPRIAFYQFYTKKAANAREQKSLVLLNSSDAFAESQQVALGEGEREQRLSFSAYAAIAKEAWRPLFDVFLVFFVTLSLFPAVLVKIQHDSSGDAQEDSFISADLFLQLSVFLNFNVFATLGNFIANFIQWPYPKYLSYVVAPRLLFIPLFLFCNYVPASHRAFPVLFTNQWTFVVLISLMSITHGYYSSLSMMYAPKAVEEAKSRIVGMMSAFFLILGITFGILFTFVESYMFSVY